MEKRKRESLSDYPKSKKKKQVYAKKVFKSNSTQNLIGKGSMKEVNCKDQAFTPGASIPTCLLASVAYIEPTVAGLGLATGYTCINTLSQGNSVSQRVGNKVVFTSIRVTGTISASDSQDITDTGPIRVVVVYDKQTNGAAPAITEILANVSSDGSYSTTFNSGIKISNRKRFVVLRDQTFTFGGLGSDDAIHCIDWFIKKKMETTYATTSTPPTVANIMTGAIYLLVFYPANSFTHVPTVSDWNIRTRFMD